MRGAHGHLGLLAGATPLVPLQVRAVSELVTCFPGFSFAAPVFLPLPARLKADGRRYSSTGWVDVGYWEEGVVLARCFNSRCW